MLCTPKPNGFADHYPYEKWLFHWEYEPNIFRQTHMVLYGVIMTFPTQITIFGVTHFHGENWMALISM